MLFRQRSQNSTVQWRTVPVRVLVEENVDGPVDDDPLAALHFTLQLTGLPDGGPGKELEFAGDRVASATEFVGERGGRRIEDVEGVVFERRVFDTFAFRKLLEGAILWEVFPSMQHIPGRAVSARPATVQWLTAQMRQIGKERLHSFADSVDTNRET